MQKNQCFKDVIGFNDRWMLIVGIPVAGVIISLLLFTEQYMQLDWRYLTFCVPISFVYTAAFWFSMRKTYHLVKLRYPTFEDIWIRMAWILSIFIGIFFLINVSLDRFFKWLLPGHAIQPNPIVEFIGSLILSALVIAIYEAASFYLQLATAIREKADLERHYVASQLEGLRNQVNPHFLFNSLNTLIYLIPETPDKAVRFVQQLSKVYRYVLESRGDKVIPLDTELKFLESYIFLLKERFGENITVEINNLENRGCHAIVPLTLQILLENAIKHNIISAEKPLKIEIFAENGHLIMRNNLQKKNQVMDSTGVGLDNIRARYQMLTDQEVQIQVSPQYYTVLLPVIDLINK